MNRRKFLFNISALGAVIAASNYAGNIINGYLSPDFEYLKKKKTLISTLAETIIPTTQTVGAAAVKADEYIIHIILNNKNITTQNNFINGLKELEERSNDLYRCDFENLNNQIRNELLTYYMKKGRALPGIAGKLEMKVKGKSFFNILKDYTCIAYCTSKEGLSKSFKYEAIPGRYNPIENYLRGDKSWGTK